jgi:alkanesulfonate monooxygenase
MSVQFIGMIGVSPESGNTVRVHVVGGGMDRDFIVSFTRAHERAGFDRVLVGYGSNAADGFLVAGYAAAHTDRMKFLIAHRPGFVAPTLAARKFATFDCLYPDRVAVHVITGISDGEQRADGDDLPKADRYRRSAEYLDIMRRTWTSREAFDFDGRFYQLRRARSDVFPVTQPHPPIYFGGSSPEATVAGAAHCDLYALFGEPRAAIADRMREIRDEAAKNGRVPEFSVSVRPVLADTEGAAWDKAYALRARLQEAMGGVRGRPAVDHSGARMLAHAQEAEVHDERLWMGIAEQTGAVGNSSCLVGTAEQVADSLLRYYDIGVRNFLIRGFNPEQDAEEYGRELIPRVRLGVLERERLGAARRDLPR